MKFPMTALSALCPVLLFLVLGCSSQPGETKDAATPERPAPEAVSPQPVGPPVAGGRIVQCLLGDVTNLLWPLASDLGSHLLAEHLYVAPLRYNKDNELVCSAAEDFEVLDDGKLLKFRLRPGIRWFDGTELTAEDVAFTYRLMIDPKTPTAYAENFKAVSRFTVTGKYSFEAAYDQPYAKALSTWASWILPKHVLEGEDLLDTKYSRDPMGAGAFRLTTREPGRRLVLTANPDYFEGRPYLDRVVYRIIPDLSTQFLELTARKLDRMALTPQQFKRQTTGPKWTRDFRKFEYLDDAYTYLAWNLKRPLFSDARVRRALAHAVDKEEIIKGVCLGLGVPTIGPYRPGSWAYNENIKSWSFDPALAKKLLAETGWTDTDGDGVLDKDGRRFSFTILTNQGNTQRIKTAAIIQNRLKLIGVEAKTRTVEWAALLKEFIDTGNFDAVIMGWTITLDPDAYDVWHSSKAFKGGLNFIGYANPEADALLEKGRRTLERAERKKIYDALQELLHGDQPYCFLFVPYKLPIVAARFQNVAAAPAGIDYNFNRWWVPAPLQTFSLTP